MQRFKIITGVFLTLITLIAATTSNVNTYDVSEDMAYSLAPKRTLAEQQAAILYKSRQQELKEAISAYFEKAIQAGDIVGAGVSIVKGDSIVISDGYGKKSIHKGEEVDGETVFRLGSLSKGFAGVLAANLVAEGKMDFNDRVTDYIPDFQFGDPQNTQKVRLAHILSHSSGTPYHSFTNLIEAGIPVATIATRFDEVKPISAPGEMYSYQNAMFSLSQEVMSKATGTDVKSLLNKRFFKPLGMNHTTMDHQQLLEEANVAMPHARNRKGWRTLPLRDRYYNAVVAGGINASSLDMAKWMRFLLGHNPEVLKKDVIEKAFKPFIKISYNNKYYQRWSNHKQPHYGFGWRIHEFQKENASETLTVWHHGGSVNNYRNEIAVFPANDLGICVLLNGNSKIARNVIPDLYKIVLNNYK